MQFLGFYCPFKVIWIFWLLSVVFKSCVTVAKMALLCLFCYSVGHLNLKNGTLVALNIASRFMNLVLGCQIFAVSILLQICSTVFIAKSIIGVKSAYHFGTLIFFHARKAGKRSILPVIWTKLLFRLLAIPWKQRAAFYYVKESKLAYLISYATSFPFTFLDSVWSRISHLIVNFN